MRHRCPVCHKTVKASAQEKSQEAECFPFCCKRCQLIDLGAWLDAKYRITSKTQSEESGELPDTSSHPSDKP